MSIKKELDNMNISDIYSMMLFVLYKSTEIPQYAALSQLAYILDKDSLLKLCEFYGGLTITIPTITQLESLLNGLLMYQLVDIEGHNYEQIKTQFEKDVIESYVHIKKLLKNYSFNSGRDFNEF